MISVVVIIMGFLYNEENVIYLEKCLEDINEVVLLVYFGINSIMFVLWLKYFVNIVSKEGLIFVCLSVCVGSIFDNGLGGWYGYCVLKVVFNMFVKIVLVEYKCRVKNIMLVCYYLGIVDIGFLKFF